MVGRQPGFTAIAAVSLALGIGAITAAFSWADAILLRPLPVLRPSTVLTVGVPATDPGEPSASPTASMSIRVRRRPASTT